MNTPEPAHLRAAAAAPQAAIGTGRLAASSAVANVSDTELSELMQAIYRTYSYDFLDYSGASQKRRVLKALIKSECPNVLALQEKVLADPTQFMQLLQYLTIPVSEMFRDPTFFLTLRDNITFADHSLATDSVFSETQLVLCRNVLIYFNKALQNRALGLFHESLGHRGFMGLGSRKSIQLSDFSDNFEALNKPERIYRKHATARDNAHRPLHPAAHA